MQNAGGEALSRDTVSDFALRHVGQIVAYSIRLQKKDDSLGPLEWHSGVVRRAHPSGGARRAAAADIIGDPLHRGDFDIVADPSTDLPLTLPTKTSGAYSFPHPCASYYCLMPETQYMRDASRALALRVVRLEEELMGMKAAMESLRARQPVTAAKADDHKKATVVGGSSVGKKLKKASK